MRRLFLFMRVKNTTRPAARRAGSPAAEERQTIRRAVEQEIDAGLFPGAVVLLGNPDRVLYHEAFGHARIVPEKLEMPKDALFDLASVTKVVATGTAVGVCVDQGLLRFETPIRGPAG